jgi:hypothetical protein
MISSAVSAGDTATAVQYNNLRKDAKRGSYLLPRAQDTPDMTVKVEAGVFFIGATRVIFAGGNSPSFSAPSGNPRIDILTINSSGTLAITQGLEAGSPTPPTYPTDKLVICEVYNRVGETSIKDTDDSANGYIYNDIRGLGFAYISSDTQIGTGVIGKAKLAETFVETSGDQTVNGIKTFGSIPVFPASNPTTDNQGARKKYVDDNIGKFAHGVASCSVTGSGTQNIAHGLGITPKKIRITAGDATAGWGHYHSVGVYDGLTVAALYTYDSGGSVYAATTTTYILVISSGGVTRSATVAIDATNITLTWTGGNTNIQMLWEAEI